MILAGDKFMVEPSPDGKTMNIAYLQSGVGSEVAKHAIDKKVYGILEDPALCTSKWRDRYINIGGLQYPVIPYGNPKGISVDDVLYQLGK